MFLRQRKHRLQNASIRSIIFMYFTITALAASVFIGVSLYGRLSGQMSSALQEENHILINQLGRTMDSYLRLVMKLSDSLYYGVIKNADLSDGSINGEITLLYDNNKDNVENIALFSKEGELLESVPAARLKNNAQVADQDWFTAALEKTENLHFSMPHVQNLFQDGTYRYHRVISLSRSVDINDGDRPGSGVLLVDMKYSVVENVLKQINESSDGVYYYVCNRDGELLYHPRRAEIDRELFKENSLKAAGYEDGVYEISSGDGKENVIVGSISYTGWKLIGVIPESVQTANINNFRYYIFTTIIILMMLLLEGNRLISQKVSKPIRELDASVKAYEAGEKPDIYIGGSLEVRHLGHSVQKSYEQIEQLMEEIMRQQNERRKSELDALQSQINPHFLYNTLESITWMVEAQKNREAVIMISELAKLLRVSLSRGKTIIPIKDELQHSRSYMNIQLVRYKERFKIDFQIDEELYNYCIVKLVIQPILENAIYYGVGHMDEDDDGRIVVSGEKKDNDIYISIEDNGMGMRKEVLENILTDNNKVPKHGSGVGVINVHSRIKLMFGEGYGLTVYSEPDEGTKVVIHIPAIPYTKENAEKLEMQKYSQRGKAHEKE